MDKKSLKLHNLEIATNGLHILSEALGLEGDQPDSTRPILLAIDFGQTKNLMNGFSGSECCQELISTYNLISGPSSYTSVVSKRVLFGTTEIIKPAEILHNIQALIPGDRNIILIGHGVQVELKILVKLGFTFSSRISSIIDTRGLAGEVFGTARYSLKSLLKSLRCRACRLHTGGNDAHFTLRASLLLAARNFPDREHPTIRILRDIALEPVPHLVEAEAIAARNKEKKIAHLNSAKYQAQFRTAEQRAEIRAERAARKARGVLWP
ncbi:unnamed protein product [Clonostachys rosea]|uniref:Gfd2/YDR514C-like C-terminal domain-containing protein n=1 Tax=Bionectria ochroleuca TaxID=29856 RepID=A0ABY6UMN1_BIOOC|nr:unnamed protein product [Clonostachys rosea]